MAPSMPPKFNSFQSFSSWHERFYSSKDRKDQSSVKRRPSNQTDTRTNPMPPPSSTSSHKKSISSGIRRGFKAAIRALKPLPRHESRKPSLTLARTQTAPLERIRASPLSTPSRNRQLQVKPTISSPRLNRRRSSQTNRTVSPVIAPVRISRTVPSTPEFAKPWPTQLALSLPKDISKPSSSLSFSVPKPRLSPPETATLSSTSITTN